MARRSWQNANASVDLVPTSSASAHSANEKNPQKQPRIEHTNNNTPIPSAQSAFPNANIASTSSPPGEGGTKKGDGDSEADEKDEEDHDDDDGNGDAPAPSDVASNQYGSWTGHRFPKDQVEDQNKQEIRPKLRNGGRNYAHIKSSELSMTAAQLQGFFDDEDYNGVDEISDSGEDEPDLERSEEENLIADSDVKFEIWKTWLNDDAMMLSDAAYFDDPYDPVVQDTSDTRNETSQQDNMVQSPGSMPSLPEISSASTRRVHFDEPVFRRSESSDVFSNDVHLDQLFEPTPRPDAEAAQASSINLGADDGNDGQGSGDDSSGYESGFTAFGHLSMLIFYHS